MGRPRLGLGFEGTLYRPQLGPADLPDLAYSPPAVIFEGLVAAAGRYELAIYPLRPAPRLPSAIRGWLLTQLERHFETQGHRQPFKIALTLIDQIDIVHDRSVVEVDLAIDAGGFPRAEDLNGLAALFETIGAPAPIEAS